MNGINRYQMHYNKTLSNCYTPMYGTDTAKLYKAHNIVWSLKSDAREIASLSPHPLLNTPLPRVSTRPYRLDSRVKPV